jgi:hypothetical protein
MRQYGYDLRSMKPDRRRAWKVLCAAVLIAAGACGKTDEAPPMATVTLTTNHKSVALGAPIELTYKFDVAPGAVINSDYRVFVHVNRDDGTTIWYDDHDLPPGMETSKWKPGQTIQYTRTRFVPTFSYLGEATVRMGLYRDSDRLPLSGIDPADRESPERSYKVATLDLLPRSESVQVLRLSGWHPGEYSAENSAIDWQWTQKLAILSFRNPRKDVLLYLEYDGRPDLFTDKPQQLSVMVGPAVVGTFPVDEKGTVLRRIPLSAAQLGTSDMVEIRLELDRTFVPAKQPGGSRDSRELGVRVYHAFIEPR